VIHEDGTGGIQEQTVDLVVLHIDDKVVDDPDEYTVGCVHLKVYQIPSLLQHASL